MLVSPAAGQEWMGRARVDGRVVDEGGAPLAGATVSARHLTRQGGAHVLSDAEGRFVLDGLAAGSWMVEVSVPGYASRQVGVHLPSDASWIDLFEVQLEKTRPEPPPAAQGPTGPGPSSSAPGRARPASADPGSPASYDDIQAALEEGRVDRAQRLLDSVDADAPSAAGVLFEIGRRLLTAGETEEAVTFFARTLERDPDHVDAHYGRALGLLALGRPLEARRDFEAIVVLCPEGVVAEKARLAIQQLAPGPADPVSPGNSSQHSSGTAE
jgi:hypothetical protein